MTHVIVGTAKGPGEHPHEFLFITPDDSNVCKPGEFVYYTLADENRAVLARISRRAPVRLFPDTFMASPDVAPAEIATAIGYSAGDEELFEVAATVMGHFEPRMAAFVNPRILPRSGSPIYLAPDEMLAEVLSKRRPGEIASASVGWLLSRPAESVPVALDVNEFTSTHLSIIAGTGAGKSYLAGVTIEELMRPYNKGCVLIADPHGEYETLLEMQNLPEFADGDYRPKVRIFKPDQVAVRVSTLTVDDLRYLLPNLGERMEWILSEAYNRVQRQAGSAFDGKWTVADLQACVEEVGDEGNARGADLSSSVQGLLWRIDRQLTKSKNFHDTRHLDLNELFRPGQCTVLELNEIDQREQQIIMATLLRRLLHARMAMQQGSVDEHDEAYLPYPAFVLLEEAHHFAPHSADAVSTVILKQVLAEGRKFGVGVGLISQRPGKLDQDVLSQCMTHFIMRIVNPVDQASVAGAVESVGRDLLDELAALSKGQVIIAGSALNTPVVCQTRQRLTRHGGSSVAAADEWQRYFERRDERERDAAVVDVPRGRSNILRLD